MTSNRTLRWVGLCLVAVAGSVVTPAPAASAAPGAPGAPDQSEYDGHLEEANAWAVDALNLEAAWESTRGGGVTIAVIDTGMSNHPFFEDKDVLPGYSTNSDDEVDAWYDLSPDSPVAPASGSSEDKRGHGTAVTSQVLLAAPEATILPIRDGTGEGDGITNTWAAAEPRFVEAVYLAVDEGADVIVTAFGYPAEPSEDVYMAMQYALDHDVVFVASAGNDADVVTTGHFPGYLPGVVTVSGLAQGGGGWEHSSTGPEVDVAGPADGSLVYPEPQSHPHMFEDCDLCEDEEEDVSPGYLYGESGGTSMASGWIGGVIGLIRAAHPDLDANNVIQRLIQTAADGGDPGFDDVFGYGVADAGAAVASSDVETVDENPLGDPLLPGASGLTADGTPAPGTGATADGAAAAGSEGGGSHLVAFAVVVVAAVVVAGGVSFLLQRRVAGSAARPGGPGTSPPATAPALSTGVMMALVVALVAATGTYVGATALVGKTESGDQPAGPAATDDGNDGGSEGSGGDLAAQVGQTAADGNAIATAAQSWQDALTAGDVEAVRAQTCENPWYRVAVNIDKLEDPELVRPGFTMLDEAGLDPDGDWQGGSYRLARASETRAWVDVGPFDIGIDTPDLQLALVREGGEWKVCDFWFTATGPWRDLPEWQARFPLEGDSVGLASTGREGR
jgi:subtilase family protein